VTTAVATRMTTFTKLVARTNPVLPQRLAQSATARSGAGPSGPALTGWLGQRGHAHTFQVDRIPFAELSGWSFDDATGNLGHHSGRFFTVEGLHVAVHDPASTVLRAWQQPIIVQPEVGILGILAKDIGGVLHLLMQAKMEPGNPNMLQLSPTVQATHSNYTRVHDGVAVRYLDYFLTPGRGTVITDVLQSEHGSWFLRKVNRNMIVEVHEDVPPHEDFCWLTVGQIGELLRRDNVVNMDTRTVLACAPATYVESAALHSDTELLSWFATERSRHSLATVRIPLAEVDGWHRDTWTVKRPDERYFKVVAVSVRSDSREVTQWAQPLFEPSRRGIAAFVMRRFGGVPHLLVNARVEGGFLDTVELGPTVQCTPEYHDPPPPFLDLVRGARPDRIRYAAVQSEEGGRFLNAENHYLIVDADEHEAPLRPPPHYFWVTPGQLSSLLRHGHYVNMQARSLLAVVNARAADLST